MSALLYSTKSGCMLKITEQHVKFIAAQLSALPYTSIHHNNILLRAAPGLSSALTSPAKYGHFNDYSLYDKFVTTAVG